MNKIIENSVNLLSTSPGCYLMYDNNNTVIYVGKAKNLKNRVSQYFLQPHTGKVGAMVSHVDHFETIVTSNDNEAFVLELNLIHKYYPRYNIMLKDDKRYPYIALKKGNDPQIKLLRNTNNKNYIYFGPYPHATYAKNIVDLINNIYPLRKCKTSGKKPCIYYQMGACLGQCFQEIDANKIEELQNEIKTFLSGKTYSVEKAIKNDIKILNQNLQYEEAMKKYDILKSIEYMKTTQYVEFQDDVDRDIFAYVIRDGYISLTLFIYRSGMLIGKDNFIIDLFDNEIDSLSDLIIQYYDGKEIPDGIAVFNKDLYENLEPIFKNKISFVQSGKMFNVLPKLIENSQKALDEYFLSSRLSTKTEETLDSLAGLLNIPFPKTIDLFDNSHISGEDAVGVAVVFVNGEPCKKKYRKYKLQNSNTQDDLSNMKEVLNRRYSKIKNENLPLPDLILLDGGENQLNIANELFAELMIKVPVFGLYKNDKHQTEGIIDKNGQKFSLDNNKDIFFLLTTMQNEVHRFAISFHRKLHLSNYKKSVLDDVKGLGAARKNALFDTFKDYSELIDASLNELKQILPEEVAIGLYNKLHKNS